MTLHLDFETRSVRDLRDTTSRAYAADPSTEVICMAWARDDGPITSEILLGRESIKCPYGKGEVIVAHNASFERAIIEGVCVPKFGWPKPVLDRYRCTAARAGSLGLPRSLDGCAMALNLQWQKDRKGHDLMMRMARPRRPRKGEGSGLFDDETTTLWFEDHDRLARLAEYCRQDVEVERAIDKKLGPLSEDEQRLYTLSEWINDRGLALDIPTVEAAARLLDGHREALVAEIADLTGGLVTSVSQVARIRSWLSSKGCELKDSTSATVADAMARVNGSCRRVLEIRQLLGLASVKKLSAMRACASADGRARGLFVYHAAMTGRWSGSKLQPQNLPRPNLTDPDIAWGLELIKVGCPKLLDLCIGDPTAVISNCLRSLIVPAPGHEFIIADFASVEARGVAWCAGQDDLVQQFAEGVDSYVNMAASVYGKDPKFITKQERTLGKTVILGCGYAMGRKRFFETCKAQGLEIDEDLAHRAVHTYRGKYVAIRYLWGDLLHRAVRCVDTGKPQTVRAVTFRMQGDFLFCRLPSGRDLAYPFPEVAVEPDPSGDLRPHVTRMTVEHGQWVRRKLHGGLLTENIVSGLCRDLLVNGIRQLEAAGYRVVGHIHDEVIVEVPIGSGSVGEVCHLLCELPTWADGFPLKAEGSRAARYGK